MALLGAAVTWQAPEPAVGAGLCLRAWFRRVGKPFPHLWLHWSFGISFFGIASVTLAEGQSSTRMNVPSPAPGFAFQGVSWPCLPDSIPSSMEVSGSPRTEENILSLPLECCQLASECLRRWTVFPAGSIQGGRLSCDGALTSVESLPCELDVDRTVLGSPPSHPRVCQDAFPKLG